MIRNLNDSTGLFSRCARNNAYKRVNNNMLKSTKHSKTLKINYKEQSVGRSMNTATFKRQQSRQQRNKRYAVQITPPVGQYNLTFSKKPKLVWDILKVYHHRFKPNKNKGKKIQQTIQSTLPLQQMINSSEISKSQQNVDMQLSKLQSNRKDGNLCMVNMSKMVGRQRNSYNKINTQTSADPTKSIQVIKSRTSKNIYFNKQTKRHDIIQRSKQLGDSGIYDSNYAVIRPKSPGIVRWELIKGRNQRKKSDNLQYSYPHYQYNQYSWANKSNVFHNTNTHLISFQNQSSRYVQNI